LCELPNYAILRRGVGEINSRRTFTKTQFYHKDRLRTLTKIDGKEVDEYLLRDYIQAIREMVGVADVICAGVQLGELDRRREELHMKILKSVSANYCDDFDRTLSKYCTQVQRREGW